MPTIYDEALRLLADFGPEYEDGNPNAGSVVAEALISMDRMHAVAPWVEGYLHRLEQTPASQCPINRHNWQTALGDWERSRDWQDFFLKELALADWPTVLADWLPRLTAGLAGAGGHGFLRTAYAVQNLGREENDRRRTELAKSLAYWAARYMKLPGIQGGLTAGSLTPSDALSRIKWQNKRKPPQFSHITAGLRGLTSYSPFTGVINLVAIPEKPAVLLSRITEACTRVYLAHSQWPDALVPYMYAVVLPSALRFMLPTIPDDLTASFLRYVWQFAGATYAIFGQSNPVVDVPAPNHDHDALIDRAVATDNEHVILFTDACIREYVQTPKPAYLVAAWHAADHFSSTAHDES